jgi:hypothetical protein
MVRGTDNNTTASSNANISSCPLARITNPTKRSLRRPISVGRIDRLHGMLSRARSSYGRMEWSCGPVFLEEEIEKLETAIWFADASFSAEFSLVDAFSPNAQYKVRRYDDYCCVAPEVGVDG